jgi:uncharacterized phiE125 gp8 family phage protein
MGVKLITAPAVEPVSLEEAKKHLHIDADDEDETIASLIMAAREWCEAFQGRAYITQSWELVLDSFPAKPYIDLPLPPLQTVDSIKYSDSAGVETTLAITEYVVNPDSYFGKIVPAYGKSWPSFTPYPAGAVRIQFTCGYGDAVDVPQMVKQAMLLVIGHLFEHREDSAEKAFATIPMSAKTLLWPDKVVVA